MLQFLIALDQALNCLVWSAVDGWGTADETLSARAWRLKGSSRFWSTFRAVVDVMFFWQRNHCWSAYDAEFERRQLPSHYRVQRVQTDP